MTFTESRQSVYTAVHFYGGEESIESAKSQLEEAGFRLADSSKQKVMSCRNNTSTNFPRASSSKSSTSFVTWISLTGSPSCTINWWQTLKVSG